ncbi:SusC/RagA family TonB-linked outer membrane protein [Myroides profundi]|uniref:TonB-linked outer membrane protein, SusC/RagA family n=1 Tax=Myroides profundi TaxID=480520 RepID=A0AAJ5BDG2_MYRPR|nr:TonB-dependent receptor [Myroides profundi]SEQ57950.1 TonB-linked outer membrane protein, SusC/RagA family [Myroides profundi]
MKKSRLNWFYASLLLLSVSAGYAQDKKLTGVVSEGGLPLPGVTVMIKGSDKGTQTDLNGNYSLNVQKGDVLVFSFVGMNDVTHKVGDAPVYNVSMTGDSGNELDAIVVTAYGTQSKASVAGSIATVKAEEIQNVVATNVTQGLVGKVGGVQIYNASGAPGQAPVIRFRGVGSISASADPLIVLDGVPYNGTMNSINTADIDNISFLKDASAAALYGNRGANGVIIITTKKGASGKVKVTVDSKIGIADKNYREYDRLTSPSEYYKGYHQALRGTYLRAGAEDWKDAGRYASANLIGRNGSIAASSRGSGLGYNIYNVANTEVVLPDGTFNPNASLLYHENWDDYVYRSGVVSQNNISVAGGTDDTKYYLSFGHDSNDGIVDTQSYIRTMTRMNIDSKINETFNVGGSLSYSNINQKDPMGGGYATGGSSAFVDPFFWTNIIAPIYPVHAYDKTGNIMRNELGDVLYDDGAGKISPFSRPFGSGSSPYAEGINNHRKNTINQLFGTGYINVNLYDGLSFKYVLSGDFYNSMLRQTQNPTYGSGTIPNGRVYQTDRTVFSVTNQQLLSYSKWFGQHSVDILLGHETMIKNDDDMFVHRTNLLFPDSPYINHAAVVAEATGGNKEYTLEGYFARLNYGYDNKYFVNASIRRDASSYFHPDNKWGTFFGVGGAWMVSKENFMKDVSWLDNLKFKISYGEQGNDNLGTMNPYQDKWEVMPSFDGGAPIVITQTFQGNKNITWEKNKNFNVGFEGTVLNGRLTVDAEYFERKVDDMLFYVPKPMTTGVSSMPYNAGNMTNKGFEVTLTGDVIRTNDLRVSLNVNATHYKNKITKLPAEQERIIAGQFIRETGGSIYDYYMKEYVGVNKENGNAQFIKIGKDGERIVVEDWNAATDQNIGKSALPKLYGGFGLNVEYKGFDLNAAFAYQVGGYGMDAKYYNYFALKAGQNLHKDYTNAWTPENVNGSMPMLYVSDANSAYSRSTMHLIKSDYLSLQNVTLGYKFKPEVTKVLGISSLRVYALIDNPVLWSKRKGYDPRLNLNGTNGSGYSLYSTYMFGVNLSL